MAATPGPTLIALNRLGELRNQDPTLYQIIQELRDKMNRYILEQFKQGGGNGGGTSPLTTKGDVWGYDTDDNRIPVGNDGEVLTADSTQALGVKYTPVAGAGSPLTTKGDVYTYDTGDQRLPVGVDGRVLTADSLTATGLDWKPAGTGTVTSVAQTVPGNILSVSGSPITTAGTLALAQPNRAANLVLAGPASGGAAEPAFRALVTADLPAGTGTVTSVAQTVPSNILAVSGSPITGAGTLALTQPNRAANLVLAGPASGGAAEPAFRALVNDDIKAVAPLTVFRQNPDITGAIDGVNRAFVLPETPTSSRILFWIDNMILQGGRDYTRIDPRVYLAVLANTPRRNVGAAYVIRGPNDGGGNPEEPPILTADTWTGADAAAVRDWNDVCYSPKLDMLVAVGRTAGTGSGGGAAWVMYSTDHGTTWTEVAPPANNSPLTGVAWSEDIGVFVAVSDNTSGGHYSSLDGITWTVRSRASSAPFTSVCWGDPWVGTRFVAVAQSNANRATWSSDGETWYVSTPPLEAWISVCYSHALRRFVAVANSGGTYDVMYSDDGGQAWTGVATGIGTSWEQVRWSPYLDLFVAVTDDVANGYDNQVMTSPDGITWTQGTTPNSDHNWWGLCWSESRRLFVAVGSPVGGGTQEVMTSVDGFAWVLGSSLTNSRFTSVFSADNINVIVAVGHANSGNQQVMFSVT